MIPNMASLTPPGYRPRLIEGRMDLLMESFGAVCVEGPRWSGKTWMSLRYARSQVNISELSDVQKIALASNPHSVLKGDTPRLVDEWQDEPRLWDAVKTEVDSSPGKGRFILTGSSSPEKKHMHHSGVGRIGVVRMRPMSLYESGDSDGAVSLKGMFDGAPVVNDPHDVTLDDIACLMVRGGWPGLIGAKAESAEEVNRDYVRRTVLDAASIDGKRRDSRKMGMLMRSLARNESTTASNETILNDMQEYDDSSLSAPSLALYRDALERLFLVDDQPAFSSNVRAADRVGKSSKRHLVDPSLPIAALGLGKDRLLDDPRTYGLMFESLCVRDLKIYAESLGGSVFHYRDATGREADAIVEMPDGRWGAFEVKTRLNKSEEGAKSLKRMADYVESKGWRKPEFLCVLCGESPVAFTRPDGVHVVPVTSLKD